MSNKEKEQKNYEIFKIAISEVANKEEKKLSLLTPALSLIGDRELESHIERRKQFLTYCKTVESHVKNIPNYQGSEQYIDKSQKDFYITLDNLKREVLRLMAKNQTLWFSKLFENNFPHLKNLLRNLIIYENQHDLIVIEKIVQEVELLRYSTKKK